MSDIIQYIREDINALTVSLIIIIVWMIHKRIHKVTKNITTLILDWFTYKAPKKINRSIENYLFHRHYKKFVSRKFSIFNSKGLRTIGTFALKLEQVFIEPFVSPVENIDNLSNRFLSGSTDDIAARQKIRVWNLIKGKDDNSTRNVNIIIGPPGSGKTMLIQFISLVFSKNRQKDYNKYSKYYIPCFIFLREHINEIVKKDIHIDLILNKEYSDKGIGEKKKVNPPKKWFYKNLKRGKCIVLLDGLDEVADSKIRRKVSKWLEKEILMFPRCQFIITSRPLGYIEAPIKNGNIFEVLPFGEKQAEQFIKNYYYIDETYRQSLVEDDYKEELILDRAKEGSNDLINRLNNTPSLKDLTENPLLLSMITMMHRYRAKLPQHRIELYSEITDVLLLHWREVKSLEEDINSKKAIAILMELAMYMMNEGLMVLSEEDANKIIFKNSVNLLLSKEVVKDFLRIINRDSGLLIEKERGYWGFAHLTFQEYFASLRLSKDNPRKTIWFKDIVTDSWWKETLLLYSASSDASTLIDCCLRNGSKKALYLATQCLTEAFSVNEEIKEKADKILDANNLLYKRILELKNIYLSDNESIEIDSDLITLKEYLLFCHENNNNENCYYLDHWNNDSLMNRSSSGYLLGVSARDSLMFCKWLTEKEKNDSCMYRLPTVDEAKQYPIQKNTEFISYWVKNLNSSQEDLHYMKDIEEIEYMKRKLPKSSIRIPSASVLLNLVETRYIYNIMHANNIYKLDVALSYALSKHIFQNINLNSKSPISFEVMYQIYFRFVQLDLTEELFFYDAFERDYTKKYINNNYIKSHLDALTKAFNNIFKISYLSKYRDESTFCVDILKVLNSYKSNKNVNVCMDKLESITIKNIHQSILKTYIARLFGCIENISIEEAKVSWGKYIIKMTELAYEGYTDIQKKDSPQWVKTIQKGKGYNIPNYDYSNELETVTKLHWWCQLMELRRNNLLEPWESIRIVRGVKTVSVS